MRNIFYIFSILSFCMISILTHFFSWAYYLFILFMPFILLGIFDIIQTKHTIRRNFPIIGNARYLMELIRPEINQYFIESNTDGLPFDRVQRSIIYQRAKGQLDTLPFGT